MLYNYKSLNSIFKLIVGGLLIGTIFGFSIQRCNVYLPSVIINQMNLKDFTMLKMFLTFYLTSSLSTLLLISLNLITLSESPVIHKRNFLGGFIMGIGIFITGGCPGTLFAQLPRYIDRYYIIIGGVIGGVTYGYMDEYINKLLPAQNQTPSTLYQLLNISFQTITIIISFIVLSVLYILELYYPWSHTENDTILNSFFSNTWSPHLTGLVVGLLQIPSYLVSNCGIGASSTYVEIGGFLLKYIIELEDYFKNIMSPPKGIIQPFFDIGIVIGAFLSSQSNLVPQINQEFNLYSVLFNFVGGFILIFGARFADGCTSGSVTGMAKLEIGSFITTVSLFIGGSFSSYISCQYNNTNIIIS